jgi:hypothetical protein
MKGNVIAQVGLCIAISCAVGTSGAQRGDASRQLSQVKADELDWPLVSSLSTYDAIDGNRMKQYVEELAAISRRSRDAGNQRWGRIAGRPSGEETQRWLADKFKAAGLQVRMDEFDLSPQAFPMSWGIGVEDGSGQRIELTSASPIITFDRYMPSKTGDLNVEAVWVGLGMASDFVDKDVRGNDVRLSAASSVASPLSWTL